MFDKPKEFEVKILLKINSIDSKSAKVFFKLTNYFGVIFFWYLGVGLFILLGAQTPNILIRFGYGLDLFNIATLLAIGLGIDLLISNILQYLFKRERPYKKLISTESKYRVRSWEMTSSFPSAHVHRAFFGVTLLILGGFQWSFVLYIFAVIVGIDRLYLGAHYPLDVIFGAIFGTVTSIIYFSIANQFISWLSTVIALLITSFNYVIIILGAILGLIIMLIGFYYYLRLRKKYEEKMMLKYGVIKKE